MNANVRYNRQKYSGIKFVDFMNLIVHCTKDEGIRVLTDLSSLSSIIFCKVLICVGSFCHSVLGSFLAS